MLRASIEYSGAEAELSGISEGAKAGDTGIQFGEQLTTFAEAAVRGDSAELASARDALREVAGSEGLVDAAGVVGNFQRMVRIADGSGIPLDGITGSLSSDFREELGLDEYRSRRISELGPIARAFAPTLRGLSKTALRVAGWRANRSS
jgi:hypothetical protein